MLCFGILAVRATTSRGKAFVIAAKTIVKLHKIACVMLVAILAGAVETNADQTRQDISVDLELVLAIDASFSIGVDERDVQRLAYVDAFRNPEISRAITSGPYRRIAVVYVEWAESGHQRIVLPWRMIASQDDAVRFANDLEAAPVQRSGATSISGALRFSASLFHGNGFRGDRQLIDISGDGLNNDGAPVEAARDSLETQGITVNALPLVSTDSDLSPDELTSYYETCVSAGPGSFTLPASSTGDFALAMQRKMIAEIAGVPPVDRAYWSRPRIWKASVAPVDCLLGERQNLQNYLDMLRDLTNGHPERWQPDDSVWPRP